MKKRPDESPQAFAERFWQQNKASLEAMTPGLAEVAAGKAAFALAAAGTPVSNESLIAHLLAEAAKHPGAAPVQMHAALQLGWTGPS